MWHFQVLYKGECSWLSKNTQRVDLKKLVPRFQQTTMASAEVFGKVDIFCHC
jgi:hypothetical protein